MTAICVGRITLIVIPLLAFIPNQLSQLRQTAQRYGTVCVVHLEKMSQEAIKDNLIQKMDGIPYKFSFTLLMLCCLQFFAEHIMFKMHLLQERGQLVCIMQMPDTFAFFIN